MKNLKKIKFGLVLGMLFMLTTSSMCSNDDDSPTPSVNNPSDVINIVNNGTWRITYYYDTTKKKQVILMVTILPLERIMF